MNGINGYHVYQDSYNRTAAYEKSGRTSGSKAADTSLRSDAAKGAPTLSDNAKDMLERLKKKYDNMDFIVANYENDEEAQKYLAGGTKEYSVLLEPEVLEKMAADEKDEQKYTNLIEMATSQLADMKEKLGDDDSVTRMGITIGKDGNASYFAELEKSSEKQRERIEKTRADKKMQAAKDKKAEEKKAEEERLYGTAGVPEKTKRTMVTADSADELLEKIRNVDWTQIKEQQRETVGGIINFGA